MRKGARAKGSFYFGCVEKQLIRRAKRSLRVMRLKLVKQVRGLSIFQDLESDGSNFKFDSLMNWKPVKFYKGGSDMVRPFKRRKNYSGKGILIKPQFNNWLSPGFEPTDHMDDGTASLSLHHLP